MVDRELPIFERHAELGLPEGAELSRLRAAMGFIPATSATPRVIAERYELVKRLGSGGMGVVYLARDRKFENAEVAVKLVRDKVLREVPGAPLALQREAQQMFKLRKQPNIVKVSDVGSFGGSTYLAMEYVKGSDLRRWLRAAERSQEQVLRAFLDAARGLAAAHAIGLVHCDFKPDNVLIDEATGEAKVTDFGIAKLLDEDADTTRMDAAQRDSGDADQRLTQQTTRISGTLPYIAPERLAGERADARSDQLSFCVSLWEALSGSLPYHWSDRESQRESLGRPPANAEHVPDPLFGRLRGRSLRACLAKGMAYRREDRHRHMGPIIEALEFTLDLRANVRRVVVGASSLAAAVGIGVVAALVLNRPPSTCEPFSASVEAHWNAERRAALAERSAELGVDSSWTLDRLDTLAGEWSTRAESLCTGDQAPPRDDPQRRCLERWLPTFAGAIELFGERGDRRTLELAPTTLARLAPIDGDFCGITEFVPEDPELASLAFEARAAAWSARWETADEHSMAALERAHAIAGDAEYSIELAHAHAARAEVLHRWEAYTAASEHWDTARAHALATRDAPMLLASHLESAWTLAHDEARDVADAEALLDMVGPLLFATATPADARPSVLEGEVRALIERRRGHPEESATLYEHAVEGYGARRDTIFAARALIGWANLDYSQGERDSAEQRLRQAQRLLEDLGPSGYRDILMLDAGFDLAMIGYEAAFEIEDEADFERAVNDVLAQLAIVVEQGPPLLQLKALAAICQLRAESGLSEGLAEVVEQARSALAEAPPNAVIAAHLRSQIELGALTGLEDERAETEVRALIADREINLGLRVGVAQTWLEYLANHERCDEWRAELEVLRERDDLAAVPEFIRWLGEHARLSCN